MIEWLHFCLAFMADFFIFFDPSPAIWTIKNQVSPPPIFSKRSNPITAWKVLSINGKLAGALPNPPLLVRQARIYFRQRSSCVGEELSFDKISRAQ
jgi:hypothetical protein